MKADDYESVGVKTKGRFMKTDKTAMGRDEILFWLKEEDPSRLAELWRRADEVRRENVGEEVHLRGLIELSNICRRNCLYCGIRAGRSDVSRYRMTREEVFESAGMAADFSYGTVVLQAGEDFGITPEFIAELVRGIKERFGLAVTLSLGEHPEEVWRLWRDAGADRYLIRFETSNKRLFEVIHPRVSVSDVSGAEGRVHSLKTLRRLGYEIGSGVMIGIPGQSFTDLARDIEWFRDLDLDMIGTGPFLAHPKTPLGAVSEALARVGQDREKWERITKETGFDVPIPPDQTVSSNLMGFKVIALTRLVCPSANIPSTTAIATNDGRFGRVTGLSRGANVVMPNLTPTRYRALYEIYPHKAATCESPGQTHETALAQIREAGRTVGKGPGFRRR